MTLKEATALRDKFYEGCTTPAEELRLADFLGSETCPAEWADEARALLALLPGETDDLPNGFGQRLYERLRQEQEAAPSVAGKGWQVGKRRLAAAWGTVAAVVAAGFFLLRPAESGLPDAETVACVQEVVVPTVPVAETESPIYNNKGVSDSLATASAPATPVTWKRRTRRKAAGLPTTSAETPSSPSLAASPPVPDQPDSHTGFSGNTDDSFEDTFVRTCASMQTMQAECMAYLIEDLASGSTLHNYLQP